MWIAVDLEENRDVEGVVTQGRGNLDQWVLTYYVRYKKDGQDEFEFITNESGIPKVRKTIFNENTSLNKKANKTVK